MCKMLFQTFLSEFAIKMQFLIFYCNYFILYLFKRPNFLNLQNSLVDTRQESEEPEENAVEEESHDDHVSLE